MTVEGVLDSTSEPKSYDDAARLLSVICPDFIKNNAEYGLDSPESFACLLYRESLLTEVKVAFAAKDFTNFWNLCVRICSMKPLKGFIKTSEVLNYVSPHLINLVNGRIDTPFWTISDVPREDTQAGIVKDFTLRSLMNQKKMPSMLFYDLGSFRNNSILNERVHKLFCLNQNTFFVNASATGKTRLLYEGLYQRWGIYVTAHADDKEAQALEAAMGRTFGGENGMVSSLPDVTALGYRELLRDNLSFLDRRFSIVLLVHLLIFREFLKTAHAESVVDDENLRRLWLLAQLWRPCLGKWKDDVHRELLESFEWEPLAVIHDELTKVMEEINFLLPEAIRKEGLFVAIDEANVAAKSIWRDVAEKHPLIRSIIRVWRDQLASLDCTVTFVVAGTEISSEIFPSSSTEWSSWKWTSDTGSFDDREAQRNYIIPFLPPSFVETTSGSALLERIWNWCRPRHRLTTVIIRMLIEDKGVHPHGVLNRYIQRLTSYDTVDAAEFIAKEGPCKVIPFFNGIGTLIQNNTFARSATHEVVFHYIITGKHSPFYDISRLALVTSGVGQFKDKDMKKIAMDQPGPTIAAAIWLGHDQGRVGKYDNPDGVRSLRLFKPFTFFYNFPWPNGDKYSPSSYIALYLAHAFVDGRAMSDVFAIPAPLWLEDLRTLAYLVVLRKDKKGVVQEMLVGPSELLPSSPPLGYRASTSDDVIAWVRQERIGAFCLCPPDCWADLIFVLKLAGKYVWVVLRATGQGIQLESKDLYTEFEHLTEHNLFSRRRNESDMTVDRNHLSEALMSLPNTLAPPQSIPMLRVLASFPDEPLLPRRNLTQKITGGPVSVLKLDTFKSITEAFSTEDLVEGLIFSMHDKRSSYSDDSFAPVDFTSSSRASKRKDATAGGQISTRILSTRKATPSAERATRPLPNHKTPPSTAGLIAEPLTLARQVGKEVDPIPQPKRPKKGSSDQSPDSSLTGSVPPSLRRSGRAHRS